MASSSLCDVWNVTIFDNLVNAVRDMYVET